MLWLVSQQETGIHSCVRGPNDKRIAIRMIGLLQRVREARVEVSAQVVGDIGRGVLVFVGVERADTEADADRLLERILTYRVFPDEDGRMNRSVLDLNGGLLLVPQFTLAADTNRGTRASFTPAADPEKGRRLFEYILQQAKKRHSRVECGRFGAEMQVSLTNDGPVTFWLQTSHM